MNEQLMTIRSLQQRVADFNTARDWNQYHTPENLAKSICIEAAELLECFQWSFSSGDIAAELADVLIYVLSLANALDIDISTVMVSKMKQNGEKYPVAGLVAEQARMELESTTPR